MALQSKISTLLKDRLPERVDLFVFACLISGLVLLYLPTWVDLATTVWARDEQGHGPIILAVACWLVWQLRDQLISIPAADNKLLAIGLLALGLMMHLLGRSQYISILEVGSQIPVAAGLLVYFGGLSALRIAWFPLFFLLFMIPLPGALVAEVTTPLKTAVSAVAAETIYAMGYPIARSGVVLTIGQYQLLVADACAGLNSMFTLEALGLLYMNLMRHSVPLRNVLLAVLIIPISFCANVVRVGILIFVTYYFGDAAGQGFVHGFAGMVLFIVALILILIVDSALGYFFKKKEAVNG